MRWLAPRFSFFFLTFHYGKVQAHTNAMVRLISPHIIGPQHQWLWTCSQTRFLRDEGSQTFSVRRQLVNILASAGHMVSITTVNSATGVKKQPQRYRNKRLWLHSNRTLFTNQEVVWIWPAPLVSWGLSGGSVVKNPPANAGEAGLIGSGRSPAEGNGNPL